MPVNFKKIMLSLCIITVISIFAVFANLYIFQESLLFSPDKLSKDHKFNLEDTKEVEISVNGAKLSALHYKRKNPKGLVFFLHGNSGNLDNWLTDTSFYEEINYDLFMIDYRGYGKSTGKITSEEQLLTDVIKSWEFIKPQYQEKEIIIYGRSIGTPLCAYLASKIEPNLTILVTPLYNINALRKLYYSWVPKFLLRYKLNTSKYLKKVKGNVVIIHGDKDRVIPLAQAKKLAKEKTDIRFKIIKDANHLNIHEFKEFNQYLKSLI